MNLEVTDEFRDLCREIVRENKTLSEWALIESDDMFQTANFIGGFESIEGAFCFSYYSPVGREFWFQVTPAEVAQIAEGKMSTVDIRPAETGSGG